VDKTQCEKEDRGVKARRPEDLDRARRRRSRSQVRRRDAPGGTAPRRHGSARSGSAPTRRPWLDGSASTGGNFSNWRRGRRPRGPRPGCRGAMRVRISFGVASVIRGAIIRSTRSPQGTCLRARAPLAPGRGGATHNVTFGSVCREHVEMLVLGPVRQSSVQRTAERAREGSAAAGWLATCEGAVRRRRRKKMNIGLISTTALAPYDGLKAAGVPVSLRIRITWRYVNGAPSA
jgi:hypothetical protein